MMVIIIGKNRAEYCKVKKKDLNKHFFVTRDQLYKIYPDALTPCEIYHNEAWLLSESVIVFEENGVKPYHCKYPKDYDMDPVLATIDEHKLMIPKKEGLKGFFRSKSKSGFNFRNLLDIMPWAVLGFILFYAFVLS